MLGYQQSSTTAKSASRSAFFRVEANGGDKNVVSDLATRRQNVIQGSLAVVSDPLFTGKTEAQAAGALVYVVGNCDRRQTVNPPAWF